MRVAALEGEEVIGQAGRFQVVATSFRLEDIPPVSDLGWRHKKKKNKILYYHFTTAAQKWLFSRN